MHHSIVAERQHENSNGCRGYPGCHRKQTHLCNYFVRPAVRGVTFLEGGITGDGGDLSERRRVVENPVASDLGQERGQAGIGLLEPAAEGDAICLVRDPPGPMPGR